MRITELLNAQSIVLGAGPKDKPEAIEMLASLHNKAGRLSDFKAYKADILKREGEGSTAVADGFAIPHAKSSAVKTPGLAAITVPKGVDYDARDGKPSNLLFMIAAPAGGNDFHMDALAALMVMLMDAEFRNNLLAAKSAEEFLEVIRKAEDAKENENAKDSSSTVEVAVKGKILAVTACPTGIAHTYMAAEALEQKAKEMGVWLKAETDGSGGAKNVLSSQEIAESDGIIIAADKNVDMARFNGKPVLRVKVADGIHKPGDLIQKVLDGKAPLYKHDGKTEVNAGDSYKESTGRKLYKHLMNGVSHMLPFVIGGGICIALSFLLDDYSINPANFGSNTPLAAWFMSLGGFAFSFMLPVLAGFIAQSIADRPGLAIGFVGGFIANLGMTFGNPQGGVSGGFLGALLAGFIAGYLMFFLRKACDRFPRSMEGIKPVLIYPLGGILMIGLIMCAVNPVMGWINTGLSNGLNTMGDGSKIILGLVLAGMMAIDMGGPINKAAYVFGTAAIASGSYDVMAAVMIGGMVPPIAIALATQFFKKKFTENERKSGPVNYIMGLCFITEGAIPFAASDPLRVIPACVVGSSTAGALSMAFGCTLRAPHGGAFVFPVIGNMPLYLAALAIGSVAGMLMLALLKKNKD